MEGATEDDVDEDGNEFVWDVVNVCTKFQCLRHLAVLSNTAN
jgi:hypothetical protein